MFDIINVSHRVFNLSLSYDSSMAQASEVAVLQNFAAERRHLLNRFQSLRSYCIPVVMEWTFGVNRSGWSVAPVVVKPWLI